MKKVMSLIKPLMNSFRKIIPLLTAMMLMFVMKGLSQIQGGVYDEKKQGIPNALIIAKDTIGNIIDSVRSDERGFYNFKILKKGKYNLEAKATGFTLKVYKNIEVINEEPAQAVTEYNDVSGATRLEIVLSPANKPKQ
jgi:hypothetical protein